jgi:tetratricopeptide (TPR) repeat protein
MKRCKVCLWTSQFWMSALCLGLSLFILSQPAKADIILPPELNRIAPIADPKSAASKAIEAAQSAISKRDLPAARRSLEGLATDPSTVHPEILLAELLGLAGFGGEGRAVLEEFSSKEPQRIDLLLAFCELSVRENRWFDGWVLANSGDSATVPEHWSPTFRQQVADRLKTLKAVCCEGRKDWKGAQEIYAALYEADKISTEAIAGLGRASFHLGDSEASLRHFEQLKKLKPETEPPHLLLAQLYDMTGKSTEAESSYRQALKASKDAEAIKVRLAFARRLIQTNQPKPTVELLADEIKDSLENETERKFLQALVARMEGRADDAQKILSPLHQQNPTTFVISNQLALVLSQTADETLRARALQIAEGNVRNLQRSSEAWATLGWIQLQLGDPSTAEKSLANASQLGPLSRDSVYYLWQLKKAQGDTQAAELLQKAFGETSGPDFFTGAKSASK